MRWRNLAAAVCAWLVAATPVQAGVKDFAANVTGLFLQILIHESGHAAAASGLGWEVTEFKPYPHICGGRLVGGCVHSLPDEPALDDEGKMNRKLLVESRQVSAAGSMASNLSLLAFSPLQRTLRPSGFAGMTLSSMLIYQNYDWIFYTVTDSLTSFEGDWYAVAKTLDVPTYYFVAPAALNYWLLKKYREHFMRKTPPPAMQRKQVEVAPPIILPRLAAMPGGRPGERVFGLAIDLAMELP